MREKLCRVIAFLLSLLISIASMPIEIVMAQESFTILETSDDIEYSNIENNYDILSYEIQNSVNIVDYYDDSFMILDDGVVVLKNWSKNTLDAIGIVNAKSLSISDDILIVLTEYDNKSELLAYLIPTKQIYTLTEMPSIDNFSMLNENIYYELQGNIYELNIRTNSKNVIYNEGNASSIYLYDSDMVAFLTDIDEQIYDDFNTSIDENYDPYKLISISTGEISDRADFDRVYDQQATYLSNYSVVVNGQTLPFSGLENGKYYTTTGVACVSHNACVRNYGDIDTLGWQCYGFAELVYNKLFGYGSYNGNGTVARKSGTSKKIVSNMSSSNISTNYLKSILGVTVLPGAHIRTLTPVGNYYPSSTNGWQHSLVYLGSDSTYVYTYEANVDGTCKIAVVRRTWSEMTTYLTSTKKGINYIAMPINYPGVTTLTATSPPTISQTSYIGGKTIQLSADSGATIYYTTNGTTPTTSSTKYTGTFNITTEGSTTIKAIAVRSGYSNSSIFTSTISVLKMSTPTINSVYSKAGMTVTIAQPSGADIYYTTNGTTPTTSSTKYTGGFTLTSSCTIKAIAVQSGSASSSVANSTISISAPATPTIKLYDTNSTIAVGSQAKVMWDKISNAYSYEVNLYKNGVLISTQTTEENLASFILNEVGEYEISIKSINFVGSSSESYPTLKLEAKAPLEITFADYDGTVLTKIEIDYGTTPTFPKTPARTGYTFKEWIIDGKGIASSVILTENSTIQATYDINTYTIRFYDKNKTTLLSTQRVNYGEKSPTPTSYTLDTGYSFAGWHIEPESDGTSIDKVDGNMTVIATQAWSNPNLPIVAEIKEAYRTEDGDSYKISVELTNWDTSITQGRLVTTLKTTEGKMVTSETDDFQIKQGVAGSTQTETITLNYNGRATIVDVIAVGINSDSDTGGAYSEIASKTVTSETDWSEWSAWSTTKPTLSDNQTMESKVQASTQTLSTTTSSTSSTLSGWTLYDTKSTTGSWSSWSTTKPTSATGRTIENTYISPTYKTQYNYYGYRDTSSRTHFCPGAGKYVWGTTFSYIETGWRDTAISSSSMTTQSCGGGLSGCIHTSKISCSKSYSSSPSYYYVSTQQAVNTAGYYKYRYQDTSYTYSFYKYSDWSDWEDVSSTTPAKISLLEEETRETELRTMSLSLPQTNTKTQTLYRYRTEVELGDASAGTEDTSGEIYKTSGNLDNLTVDFEGNLATILVYQRTNSDPTSEILQYVGQTTIGKDNSYNFEFKPKSEPSDKTGDFIVSLALEGATNIVNIDVINAPKTVYKVTFMADGEILEVVEVEEGSTAIIPTIPQKNGHIFVGWDDYTTNIDGDLTITANFIKQSFAVVYLDFVNNTADIENFEYGSPIISKETPQAIGKTFINWYTIENGLKVYINENTIITDNTLIYADWETDKYIVKFIDNNGESISEQEVNHGEGAQLPVVSPTVDGMIFIGWSTDISWWNVTDNITVYPLFQYSETTEAPTVDSNSDDILNLISFNSSTENSTIYYTIENLNGVSIINDVETNPLPIGFTNVYNKNEPIIITQDVNITLVSYVEGKNLSEISTIYIEYQDPYEVTDPDDLSYAGLYMFDYVGCIGQTISMPIYISDSNFSESFNLKLNYDTSVFERISTTSTVENSQIITTLDFKILDSAISGYYTIQATPIDASGNDMYTLNSALATITVQNGEGYSLTGAVKSYNPTNTTKLELYQDNIIKYSTTISAENGNGQVTQDFAFSNVEAGTYSLLVTKNSHTSYEISNIVVNGNLDLTTNSNSQINLISLLCGDINGDNEINQNDLNILWLPSNYNKTLSNANSITCDLNGDGEINQNDLNILWLPINYNKGKVTVNW